MECHNCGIDYDTRKFGARCPDCLFTHEESIGATIYIDINALPRFTLSWEWGGYTVSYLRRETDTYTISLDPYS